ncbi:U3 small nucleolar ribonucleoprotein complex, subunit Mpp10 [Multifurca ochricompacta]|uniref:U3 small nucleolar ribonucleoprotein protein MPP10 n=1 Tax=Multifurca ochricompacta TaxID=376703 RepID=A0AAD4MCZ4_9AGAM|nr:U3 small nucleolar ribonucleoprotein complex, subunit Mpp10 [Multifurca ochricompacta]
MNDIPEESLPTPFHQLSSLLEAQLESFISGNKEIQGVALRATELVFNLALNSESQAQPYISALLASFSPTQAPVTRSQSSANGKRKRSPSPPSTPKGVFEHMDRGQIWAQLELRAQHVCKMLEYALDGTDEHTEDDTEQKSPDEGDSDISFGENGGESGGELETDEEGRRSSGREPSEESIIELRDGPVGEDEEHSVDGLHSLPSPFPLGANDAHHPGLNDGFFDLAAFNMETEEAEAGFVSNGALDADSEVNSSDEDNVDYFASIDGQLRADDISEPRYSDFFDPQPSGGARKKSPNRSGASTTPKVRFHDEVKVKTIKARGKGIPVSAVELLDDGSDDDDDDEENDNDYDQEVESEEEGDPVISDAESSSDAQSQLGDNAIGEGGFTSNDGHRIIKRLKDDLLAEEDEHDSLSTHEKRLASLRQQIAALEAENIAKKDWTLMGEATSRIRPHNSLLEEDLEFEHVMKAVPVITEETVLGLEDKIKARILEGRFDDVVRKRPVDDKPFLPSRFFELQDTKSKKSLAQIYEDEYTAAQTGGVAGEDRDGKLKAEHEEITNIWEGISSKLDALSNAHFTPKVVSPTVKISTITNVASTNLESVLPTSNTIASMLAPEEIFERSSADPAPGASFLRKKSGLRETS